MAAEETFNMTQQAVRLESSSLLIRMMNYCILYLLKQKIERHN